MASSTGTHATLQTCTKPPERTLLQIENNASNARLLKEIIARRIDLQLLTVTDGRQGVEMARALQPDLVVMDLSLPQLNGLDALALLRGSGETAHIPVIVLSADAFATVKTSCLQAGAFAYLTKPYQITDLMATIDSALQQAGASPKGAAWG